MGNLVAPWCALDPNVMPQVFIDFASRADWHAAVWLILAGLAVAAAWQLRRMVQRNAHLTTALNNMSQGLCMWSPSARLIVCNERYIQMYDLDARLVQPGSQLRELLEQRIKVGNFAGNPDQYIADLLNSVAKGKTTTIVREHKGRIIAIVNRPMPDGGWVGTHEDITDQRMAEQQRSSMKELESRRATIEDAIDGFRQRVESVLRTVSDSAGAMQTTATSLFNSSEQTSLRAEGAVRASNDASSNVDTAATAASQLSSSISEISQQLT